MASHTAHRFWFPTWNHQPPQPNRGAAPTVGRWTSRGLHPTSHRSTEPFLPVHSHSKISDEELSTFSTSHHSNHVEFLAYGEYALYWFGWSNLCQVAQGPSTIGRTKKRPYDEHTKTETWWAKHPAEALETVQKVAVMMGIPITMLNKNFNATNLIKSLTAAISMTNWLAPPLRRKLQHKLLQSYLQALHSMILVISILTPFTMASTTSLFEGFQIIQTRMMVLSVIHVNCVGSRKTVVPVLVLAWSCTGPDQKILSEDPDIFL